VRLRKKRPAERSISRAMVTQAFNKVSEMLRSLGMADGL
jgi:hypothetical protein